MPEAPAGSNTQIGIRQTPGWRFKFWFGKRRSATGPSELREGSLFFQSSSCSLSFALSIFLSLSLPPSRLSCLSLLFLQLNTGAFLLLLFQAIQHFSKWNVHAHSVCVTSLAIPAPGPKPPTFHLLCYLHHHHNHYDHHLH